MSRAFATIAGLAFVAASCLPTVTSAQITRGAISGTVRDSSGAVLPGATVTVTNVATNGTRVAISDGKGFFRVPALDPAVYSVECALTGFQSLDYKNVKVETSGEVTLNAELTVARIGEVVTVEGEAGAIELNKVNPTVGLTSGSREATELPLSAGRDINALIASTPNTLVVTGQGDYAANGQRSRNNNYMIDGSDNNDISVTIATSQIVPEAVAEFQVQTNAYSVEFGRNSGAQVNVITKSGSNQIHGQVWDYFRTSSLFALSNTEKDQELTEAPEFKRHQAGASLGGPIIKDKTFFFLLYQYDGQRPGETPGTTVRIPTAAGFAALQSAPLGVGQTLESRNNVLSRIAFLQDIYAQNPVFKNPTTLSVNGVPVETGQTNVDITSPSTYHTLLGRLDHRLTASDNLTIRYSYNKRKDENAISNCSFGALFCGSQDLKDANLAVSETHIFNPSFVNEFRFSWVQRDLLFPENDPASPTATISGLFTIGGSSNFPQSRVTDSYQFSNTATWTKGRHTLKVGADVRYNKADNESAFNSKGTFGFNNLQDYWNNVAATFQQALQTSSWNARQWQTGLYAQDDFRLTPDLTLNLGLRYELADAPLGFFGATEEQVLNARVPGPVTKDKNNLAPRVGFAWSPRSSNALLGDGKTVFRGGFGMGYDLLFWNLLTVNGSNYPRVVVPLDTNVKDVYPNLKPVSGSAVFNPLAQFVNSAEDTENPESKFWSFEVGRDLGDFVLELGYAGSRGYKGINQIELNPGILTEAQAALVASAKNPAAIPSLQLRRLYPQFGSRLSIPATIGPGDNDVEARSTYQALFASLRKRMSHGLQFRASYTLSKFMSNNDASLGEAGTDASSQRPQSMFDYASEWSRSQFDRPHRFVVDYLYEIPGPKSGLLKQVLGGWQVSGVTVFQSGRPITIWTGVDSSGDGNTASDRPNIGSGSIEWIDGGRSFTNNGYYVAPLGPTGLPLQNALGNGNAPRNSERSASTWNTDLTLMKRFILFTGKQLILRADAFNAFNQDNYGIPVRNMTSPDFGKNLNDWGKRTITLSAKVTF